jgi:hypothetical protein
MHVVIWARAEPRRRRTWQSWRLAEARTPWCRRRPHFRWRRCDRGTISRRRRRPRPRDSARRARARAAHGARTLACAWALDPPRACDACVWTRAWVRRAGRRGHLRGANDGLARKAAHSLSCARAPVSDICDARRAAATAARACACAARARPNAVLILGTDSSAVLCELRYRGLPRRCG